MGTALRRLNLAPCQRHRPGALSNNRGRQMTMTIDVVYKGSLLMFSRPADNLSFSDVARITKLVRQLSSVKGIVFVIARSFRFIYHAYSHILRFSRNRVPSSMPIAVSTLPGLERLFSISSKGRE